MVCPKSRMAISRLLRLSTSHHAAIQSSCRRCARSRAGSPVHAKQAVAHRLEPAGVERGLPLAAELVAVGDGLVGCAPVDELLVLDVLPVVLAADEGLDL